MRITTRTGSALLVTALALAGVPLRGQAQDMWYCEALLCLQAAKPWSIPECVPSLTMLEQVYRTPKARAPVCPYVDGGGSMRGATGEWCPEQLKRNHPDIKDAKICLAKGSIDVFSGEVQYRVWYGIVNADTGNPDTYTETVKQ